MQFSCCIVKKASKLGIRFVLNMANFFFYSYTTFFQANDVQANKQQRPCKQYNVKKISKPY